MNEEYLVEGSSSDQGIATDLDTLSQNVASFFDFHRFFILFTFSGLIGEVKT